MTKIRKNSAWSLQEIGIFFDECVIPAKIACIANNGAPIVCSLWYLYDDGALWCATQHKARVVEYLDNHPLCGFEIAPEKRPYRGVRGQGGVAISREQAPAVLRRLIDRYIGTRESAFAQWLLSRADEEVAIRINPTWMTAWDYSKRMEH